MDINDLINQFANEEAKLQNTLFIAPCVQGGTVCTRVNGLVYRFKVANNNQEDWEGWGLFKPQDAQTARLEQEADLAAIDQYLQLFKAMRMLLVFNVQHSTWLAYPANTSDMQQRLGFVKPMLIHLVQNATTFDQVVARWDGSTFWFETLDRRSDPFIADDMRLALTEYQLLTQLQIKNLTPEMKTVYDMVLNKEIAAFMNNTYQHTYTPTDRLRLERALETGGGSLQSFTDQGNYWQVEWRTSNGEAHISSIGKNDLTVLSSGICLDGEDEKFDLQSLVAVIEGRY